MTRLLDCLLYQIVAGIISPSDRYLASNVFCAAGLLVVAVLFKILYFDIGAVPHCGASLVHTTSMTYRVAWRDRYWTTSRALCEATGCV